MTSAFQDALDREAELKLMQHRFDTLEPAGIFHTHSKAPVTTRVEPILATLTQDRDTIRLVPCFSGLAERNSIELLHAAAWKWINAPFLAVLDTAQSSVIDEETEGPKRSSMSVIENPWINGLHHMSAAMVRLLAKGRSVTPSFALGIPLYKHLEEHTVLIRRGVTMGPTSSLHFPAVVCKVVADSWSMLRAENELALTTAAALAYQRNLVTHSPLKKHEFEPAVVQLISVGTTWRVSLGYISKDDGKEWQVTIRTICDTSIATVAGQTELIKKLENASEWLHGPYRSGILAHLDALDPPPPPKTETPAIQA